MTRREEFETRAVELALGHSVSMGETWHQHLVILEAALIWYMRGG